MESVNTFMVYLHLAFPLLSFIGGCMALFTAITGMRKFYEDDERMQKLLQRMSKTTLRCIHGLIGVGLIAFACYLMRGWLLYGVVL